MNTMTHDTTPPDDRPDWWDESARIKDGLGLPAYEPPAFDDGVPTHEVVEALADRYDCEITFTAKNPVYPDSWSVRIDGEPAFPIDRVRTVDGNTRYQCSSSTFVDRFESVLDEVVE